MLTGARFLESLSAKVHPTPLSIDTLSEMFQDFYRRAESHITTHIAALSSQLSRAQSASSLASRKQSPDKAEQQLLTVSEISDRKKARRLLEIKRVALEEAVERAVCEKVYSKIWHHRSADDEERDQKFRSRIAALALVGIGLKELLVSGSEDVPEDVRRKTVEQEDKIRDSLSVARASIQDMTQEKYPLGKLHHLTSAHKSIVETLSDFFPSSSSADEILPTLIYTLITSDPQDVNVISDLHFIQRFRTISKIDGETAYCLVNLEAAISFLETVELPSLRPDEVPQGPDKTAGHPNTPRRYSTPMKLGITPASDLSDQLEPFPTLLPTAEGGPGASQKSSPAPARSPRRLSNLIQMQTNRLEAAGDHLRDAVLDSADQALDTINSTLENSFRFLFGRIREEQQTTTTDGVADVPVPKTLEDARKLVSTPPPPGDDDGSTSAASPPSEKHADGNASVDDPLSAPSKSLEQLSGNRVLDLVGGRRPLRDRSVDSSRSGGSNKRVSFVETSGKPLPGFPAVPADKDIASPGSMTDTIMSSPPPVSSPLASGSTAVESMRNLGSTLNPLNQFAKIGLFGRTPSTSNGSMTMIPSPTSAPAVQPVSSGLAVPAPRASLTAGETKVLAVAEELRKMQPPSRRFLECKDARDLKLGEVEELLAEFKRMAGALGKVVGP